MGSKELGRKIRRSIGALALAASLHGAMPVDAAITPQPHITSQTPATEIQQTPPRQKTTEFQQTQSLVTIPSSENKQVKPKTIEKQPSIYEKAPQLHTEAEYDAKLAWYTQTPRELVTYDWTLDQYDARELLRKKAYLSPEEYQKEEQQFRSLKEYQLKTLLSERFKVATSTIYYDIKDGQLYGQNMDEPFLTTIKRGRDVELVHGNPVDFPRIKAEYEGFKIINADIADEETPEGATWLSITPRGELGLEEKDGKEEKGSRYQNNFFDVHQKVRDAKGNFVMKTTRFATNLSRAEFQKKAAELDSRYATDREFTDADFLKRPIKIDPAAAPFSTAEDLQLFMQSGEYTSLADFQVIWNTSTVLATSYINTILAKPESPLAPVTINAMINDADEANVKLQQRRKQIRISGNKAMRDSVPYPVTPITKVSYTPEEIWEKGSRPVREVLTGCGKSGGMQGVRMQGMEQLGSTTVARLSGGLKDSGVTLGAGVGSTTTTSEYYDYNKPGPCGTCGAKEYCGPCGLCRMCDFRARMSTLSSGAVAA